MPSIFGRLPIGSSPLLVAGIASLQVSRGKQKGASIAVSETPPVSNWRINTSMHGCKNVERSVRDYKISRSFCFCADDNVMGNLTLYLMMKFPRWPGFLEMGMPRPGYESELPGWVGPPFSTAMLDPSIVVTVRFHPVSASLRSSSTVCTRSSPSRVKSACGF